MRITLLGHYNNVIGHLDSDYYADEFHPYLAGAAYSFKFTVLKGHRYEDALNAGCKLWFTYKNKPYYLNIVQTTEDERSRTVTALGGSFELMYQMAPAVNCENHTITDMIRRFTSEEIFEIGNNELDDTTTTYEFKSATTTLKRLYEVADLYSAELEIIPVMRGNVFDHYKINIYRKHGIDAQGLGQDRTAEIIRWGKDINSVQRSVDVTEMYTAIHPIGAEIEVYDDNGQPVAKDRTKEDKERKTHKIKVDIKSLSGTEESDGFLVKSDGIIYYVQGNVKYPSVVNAPVNNGYIVKEFTDSSDTPMKLYQSALADLRKCCVPKVTYTVDGYVDLDIGDAITIEDRGYTDGLYVTARVVEQSISFTEPMNSKTTFDNFTEVHKQTTDEILTRYYEIVEANKTYTGNVATTNGTVFKGTIGQTDLTARVFESDGTTCTRFTINWYKNDVLFKSNSPTITVKTSDVPTATVFSFKAMDGDIERCSAEITLVQVFDGEQGTPGPQGPKGDDGAKGDTGPEGPKGDTGPQGPQGPKGDTGPQGQQGEQGPAGSNGTTQKIVSVSNEYYLSNSNTSQTGGSWSGTYPAYVDGKYLWTRIKTVYENPAATKYTSPVLDESWKNAGEAVAAANNAASTAQAASTAATQAQTDAAAAVSTANSVNTALGPIRTGIDEAKAEAADAKRQIGEETRNVLNEVSRTYVTQNDFTTLENSLDSRIEASATEIATSVSQTTFQNNIGTVNDQLSSLNADLTAANGRLSGLESAQATAEATLTQARQDLEAAQQAVDDLERDQSATASQLAAAQTALTQAQAAVSKAQSDVDNANAAVAQAQDDIIVAQGNIGALTNRVTTAETNIAQNSDQIALKANQTDLLYNSDWITDPYFVQGSANPDRWYVTAIFTDGHMTINRRDTTAENRRRKLLAGQKVWCRMIVDPSGLLHEDSDRSAATSVNIGLMCTRLTNNTSYYPLIQGANQTQSGWITVEGVITLDADVEARPFIQANRQLSTGEYAYTDAVGTAVIKYAQWIVIDEGAVNVSNAALTVKANEISAQVTTSLNTAKSYTDTQTAGAKSYTDTQIASAKSYTDTQLNVKAGEISQSVSSVTSRVTNLENMKIGGRNYVVKSDKAGGAGGWATNGGTPEEVTLDGRKVMKVSWSRTDVDMFPSVIKPVGYWLNLELDTDYVVSCEMMFPLGSPNVPNYNVPLHKHAFFSDSPSPATSGNSAAYPPIFVKEEIIEGASAFEPGVWKKVVVHYKTKSALTDSTKPYLIYRPIIYGQDSTRNPVIYFRNYKFEKGTVPTDWTPAPEDIQSDLTTGLDTLESDVNEIIESKTANLTTSLDSISGKVEEQITKISTLQTTVDKNSTEINARAGLIEASVEKQQKDINTLNGTVETVNNVKAWMKFDTDNGLEIGKVTDDQQTATKLRLQDTGVTIVSTATDKAVASFTKDALVTENIEAHGDLVMSNNWEWSKRPNGNLSLRWKGDE